MSTKSFVYGVYPLAVAEAAGYFQPKETNQKLDPSFNGVYMDQCGLITTKSTILYFPGAFGSFHRGHVDCVNQAVAAQVAKGVSPANIVVIISPAHSDYVSEKYGPNSPNASNVVRYNQIKAAMQGQTITWGIDLAPMLNYRCDNNLTDIAKQFVESQGLDITQLSNRVVIVCGKDRQQFMNLRDMSPYFDVCFVEDTTGESTSKSYILPDKPKVDLILRVNNDAQGKLFVDYFSDQYKSIEIVRLDHECERAKALARQVFAEQGLFVTICKQYQHFAPYNMVSRVWINPLEQAQGQFYVDPILEKQRGKKVLDSDIFSGSTADFLKEAFDIEVVAVHDLRGRRDVELLDVVDFISDWKYPYVDVSSRASMNAFAYDDYAKFDSFREALATITKR